MPVLESELQVALPTPLRENTIVRGGVENTYICNKLPCQLPYASLLCVCVCVCVCDDDHTRMSAISVCMEEESGVDGST
jgi:hypothetical protein